MVAMAVCSAQAQAQDKATETTGTGDSDLLQQCFSTLKENRKTYNIYNDSIFAIKDHDLWVEFFQHRAEVNHRLFDSNKAAIQAIDRYFDHTNGYRPQEDYDMLSNLMGEYLDDSDPFISLHILEILNDYYKNGDCPDSLNCQLPVTRTIAYFCKQISNLGHENAYLKRAYELTKSIVYATPGKYKYETYCKIHAMRDIITFAFIGEGACTIDEAKHFSQLLRDALNDTNVIYNDAFRDEKDANEVKVMSDSFEERLIRNYYLKDTTIMEKSVADSLMRVIVKKNLDRPSINFSTSLRTLLFQVQLGDMSMNEARKEALRLYIPVRNEMKRSQHLTEGQLKTFLIPFNSLFYINDLADLSYSAKRHTVKALYDDIVTAYNKRHDQQKATDYVKYLNIIIGYDRVNKYLKPDERIDYLNKLIVSTHVTTYAHSMHVSAIAAMLTEYIIQFRPKLLVGMLGCRSVHEVRARRKEFVTFIKEAATYHDLGKNQIIPIVNNDYRPMSDSEYAIVKQHPELGLDYLKLSPELAKYHDTTLGHHKWYDGKGGYPDSFDNTKSTYRTLIDIITVADCMQAATERVGRNYKGEKTFDTVMEEFRRQAGTRYNPDLVRFIDEHPRLCDELRKNLSTGWLDIYYDIYSQFIE